MEYIVETNGNVTTDELRGGKLALSQPAEGGWHFYAEDENPERAAVIASAWAQMFAEQVLVRASTADGPNSFIEVTVTQIAQLPVERSIPLSNYLFIGAIAFLAVASFLVLFFIRAT
jgi:hypothetical protein